RDRAVHPRQVGVTDTGGGDAHPHLPRTGALRRDVVANIELLVADGLQDCRSHRIAPVSRRWCVWPPAKRNQNTFSSRSHPATSVRPMPDLRFWAHARLADVCIAAADEIDFPKEGRFAVGDIPGFRAYDELKDGQPIDLPADRTTGGVMNYTSGTTGKPKGVRRPLPGTTPEASSM